MKLILVFITATGLALAQQTPKAPVKKAAVAETIKLPSAAKPVADGTWEHTDAAGKQWIYKQMPFGLTKFSKADFDARSAGVNTIPPELTVVEENGAYKFTRRTPFGGVSYVKKSGELNETERAVAAAASRKRAAN
jgi:hypothetical protein